MYMRRLIQDRRRDHGRGGLTPHSKPWETGTRTDTTFPAVDDQWKIGFRWDVDVAAPVVLMFFVGYLSGTGMSFAICLATGIFLSRWISRAEGRQAPAYAIHWLYWHLPASPSCDACDPAPHLRRMVG